MSADWAVGPWFSLSGILSSQSHYFGWPWSLPLASHAYHCPENTKRHWREFLVLSLTLPCPQAQLFLRIRLSVLCVYLSFCLLLCENKEARMIKATVWTRQPCHIRVCVFLMTLKVIQIQSSSLAISSGTEHTRHLCTAAAGASDEWTVTYLPVEESPCQNCDLTFNEA